MGGRHLHQGITNTPTGGVTSSNSSVILRMISAFCMFLNISILTVPGHRAGMSGLDTGNVTRLISLGGGALARPTFAPRALDEKIDEVQQRQVPVLFVGLDPLVHHRLNIHRHGADVLFGLFLFTSVYLASLASHPALTCMALLPSLTTSNRVTGSPPSPLC